VAAERERKGDSRERDDCKMNDVSADMVKDGSIAGNCMVCGNGSGSILERLCDYFNGFEGKMCGFFPETFLPRHTQMPRYPQMSQSQQMPNVQQVTKVQQMLGYPQAAVAMLSGSVEAIRKMYVDGSYYAELPFEIRLRISASSMREKLDAMEFFDSVEAYIEENPLEEVFGGCRLLGIKPLQNSTKSAVLSNGDEEYRMSFCVRYYKSAKKQA